MDLNAPLLSMVSIDGVDYPIHYEELHLLCKKCGLFGHTATQCHERTAESYVVVVEKVSESISGYLAPFDSSWIVVQKKKNRP